MYMCARVSTQCLTRIQDPTELPPPKELHASRGPIAPQWWRGQAHMHATTMVAHTRGAPLPQFLVTTPIQLRARLSRGLGHVSSARHVLACTPPTDVWPLHVPRSCRPHTQPQWWRMLMQPASRSHNGGAAHVASLGIDQSAPQCAVALQAGGGLSGRLPIFRSRGSAEGRGGLQPQWWRGPTAATMVARPHEGRAQHDQGGSLSATSSSWPPSPKM